MMVTFNYQTKCQNCVELETKLDAALTTLDAAYSEIKRLELEYHVLKRRYAAQIRRECEEYGLTMEKQK